MLPGLSLPVYSSMSSANLCCPSCFGIVPGPSFFSFFRPYAPAGVVRGPQVKVSDPDLAFAFGDPPSLPILRAREFGEAPVSFGAHEAARVIGSTAGSVPRLLKAQDACVVPWVRRGEPSGGQHAPRLPEWGFPAKLNACSEGIRTQFRYDPEHHRRLATLAPRLCAKVFGFVKGNLSGAKRRKGPASGERGAGKGGRPCPASAHSDPGARIALQPRYGFGTSCLRRFRTSITLSRSAAWYMKASFGSAEVHDEPDPLISAQISVLRTNSFISDQCCHTLQ